jgi:excisionase family DNA binding protein
MVTGELKATMTVNEMAEFMGISLSKAYESLYEVKLPARKIGAKWIISRNAVTRWLEDAPAIPITQRGEK